MGDLLIIVSENYNSVAININTIVYIQETKGGCSIYLNDGTRVDCTRSFSEVIEIFRSPFHSPYQDYSKKNVFIQKNTVN